MLNLRDLEVCPSLASASCFAPSSSIPLSWCISTIGHAVNGFYLKIKQNKGFLEDRSGQEWWEQRWMGTVLWSQVCGAGRWGERFFFFPFQAVNTISKCCFLSLSVSTEQHVWWHQPASPGMCCRSTVLLEMYHSRNIFFSKIIIIIIWSSSTMDFILYISVFLVILKKKNL